MSGEHYKISRPFQTSLVFLAVSTVAVRKLCRLGYDLIGTDLVVQEQALAEEDTNILILRIRPQLVSIRQIGSSRRMIVCRSIWMRWLWSRWIFAGVEHFVRVVDWGLALGFECIKTILDLVGLIYLYITEYTVVRMYSNLFRLDFAQA